MKLFWKKEKSEILKAKNKIFGNVTYMYNWMTDEQVTFSLYGKELLMNVQICTDNKEDPILETQENLFEIFKETINEIEKNVENILNNEFPFPEGCHKSDVFSGGTISFSVNEKCGMSLDISEEYADSIDMEEIGVFSGNSFFVCLIPEIFIVDTTEIFEELFG